MIHIFPDHLLWCSYKKVSVCDCPEFSRFTNNFFVLWHSLQCIIETGTKKKHFSHSLSYQQTFLINAGGGLYNNNTKAWSLEIYISEEEDQTVDNLWQIQFLFVSKHKETN